LGGGLGDFAANVIRGRTEQALRAATDERGERLDGSRLRHVAEVSASPRAVDVAVDGVGQRSRQLGRRRRTRDLDPQAPKRRREVLATCGVGELRQQIERAQDAGVGCGAGQVSFRCIEGRGRHRSRARAATDELDNLTPPFCAREPAETDVSHQRASFPRRFRRTSITLPMTSGPPGPVARTRLALLLAAAARTRSPATTATPRAMITRSPTAMSGEAALSCSVTLTAKSSSSPSSTVIQPSTSLVSVARFRSGGLA